MISIDVCIKNVLGFFKRDREILRILKTKKKT